MDPNVTLYVIRACVEKYNNSTVEEEVNDAASRLVEMVESLDGWLSGGGNPPEAWREGPDAVGEDEYVTGDGERHADLRAAFDHANDVQASTGHIIAVELARDDDYTPEGMDRTDVATADEARQAAMEWQARSADRAMSYGELAEWQGYFSQLGERFGLTAEFRENGII